MKRSKQLTILYTSIIPVAGTVALAEELLPAETRVANIVDDSLLADVLAAGGLTRDVTRRICQYALAAEDGGADLILSQCSSVGEAIQVARQVVRIPILRIDGPMAEEAVRRGPRVVVAATLPTTLQPTCDLVAHKAQELDLPVEIRQVLAEGAFDALSRGDPEQHNLMVLEALAPARQDADVIVLAQGSMAVLAPELERWGLPALTSPRLGMLRAKEMLEAM